MFRRMLLLLMVGALMAAMMAMSAVSASAIPDDDDEFTKELCKELKKAGELEDFAKNQGQCIKLTKG